MGGAATNTSDQNEFSFNPNSFSYQFVPDKPWQMGDTGQALVAKGISDAASKIGSGISYAAAKPSASAANPTYDQANYVGGHNPMYQGGHTYTPTYQDWTAEQLQAKFPTSGTGLSYLDSGVNLQSVLNPYKASLPSYWR
jgi:hypothetical protein